MGIAACMTPDSSAAHRKAVKPTEQEKADMRITAKRYATAATEIADAIEWSDKLHKRFTNQPKSRLQIVPCPSKVRDAYVKELRALEGKASKPAVGRDEGITLQVKIFETLLTKAEFTKDDGSPVSATAEVWILKENIFDRFFDVYDGYQGQTSVARMLSFSRLDSLGLRQMVKYPQAEFVVALRRRVAKFGDEEDVNNLIAHEAVHFILGHDGSDHESEEAQVDKELGEVEVANHLFLQRCNIVGLFDDIKKRKEIQKQP